MKTNLLGKLTRNLAIKIVSVIIAILIWYVVVDFNDPIETESYSVQIEVLNPSYIANGKEMYRIEDNYRNVTVYVTGNRSRLNRIQNTSIRVTADLTEIVDMDSDPVMVPLRASCPGFTSSELSLSRDTIPIIIENVANKEFPVVPSTGNTVPGSEYEVGTMTPNPGKVTISGPESIISRIDTVRAEIDVTGMVQNGTKAAELKLYDDEGDEISEATIDENLTFNGSTSISMEVDVELWKKKSEVALKVNYSGTPARGFQVGSITTVPDEVTVAGSQEALEALAEQNNVLTIPADQVSVEGATTDLTQEIDLAKLLPEEMKLSANTSETVTVYVAILPAGSREYDLPVERIQTRNLGEGLVVRYDQTELPLRIQGSDADLNALDLDEVTASVDLSGRKVGDYALQVEVSLPEGYELVDDVSLTVHVLAAAESSGGGEDPG